MRKKPDSLKFGLAGTDLKRGRIRGQKAAAPLFEKVVIKKLVTKEETTSDSITAELKKMQALRPDDLFVFYLASHGTVDDGEYFLITSNVGSTSTAKLKADALGQTALKGLIANIPTTKKLIVIDTCNAGAARQKMPGFAPPDALRRGRFKGNVKYFCVNGYRAFPRHVVHY